MWKRLISTAIVGAMCGLSPGYASSVRDRQQAGGDPSLVVPTTVDFPTADQAIWGLQLAGLRAKVAARRLEKAPDDSLTLQLLMDLGRYDDVLKVLRRIVDSRPDDLAAAFKALGFNTRQMLGDGARNHGETLGPIVAAARRRLAAVSREQAAIAAREIVKVEAELARQTGAGRSLLTAFVAEYAGTEAAQLAEVDLLEDGRGRTLLGALDAFIEAHPGTTAAAKALHRKGSHIGQHGFSFGERQGHDPTDRFFRVVDVYKELRSGRYPPSEWLDRAPAMIVWFSAYQPSYAASNVDRILKVYEELLPSLLQTSEADGELTFVIGNRMGSLFKVKGDAVAGIEDVFDRLERIAQNPDAVRLLKAEFYLRPTDPVVEEKERPALRAKGQATLEALTRQSTGLYQRKALATLATLRFGQGDHAAARDLYRRYLDAYPASDYAWVAALRIGQCEEAMGNAAGAADTFSKAAQRFASNPVARVLGHAYAARASESAGDYTRALAGYQSAHAAWDADYGLKYSFLPLPLAPVNDPFTIVDGTEVVRDALPVRISELKRTTAVAGGALVERGRWLVTRGRWDEAVAALASFASQHPTSPLVPEARRLNHRARLEKALELSDSEKPGADVNAALEGLKALGLEAGVKNAPAGFEIAAAQLALATLTFVGGAAGADALMADAVKTWQAIDTAKAPSAPLSAFQRDVVEIRNAVFRPKGGGLFESDRWNAFKWEVVSSQFLTVDPELRVKSADGEVTVVTAYDTFPEFSNVLFLDAERRRMLERIMLKIGGTRRRPWTRVMDTPNQPAGPSLDVAALWKKSFWTQSGHWSGWVFESYPIVDEIEFIDAARTRAAVKVTVGYSGATVQLEKKNGAWVATALTNFWIT